MESYRRFKSAFVSKITDQCYEYERVLEEELTKRMLLSYAWIDIQMLSIAYGDAELKSYESERDNLLKEIDLLQQRVSEIDQLRSENAELRGKIERAAKRKQGSQAGADGGIPISSPVDSTPVDRLELQRVSIENDKLAKLFEEERHAHGRAVIANQQLREKCKYYKDQAKNWQVYHDRGVQQSTRKKVNNDPEPQAIGSVQKTKQKGSPLASFSSAFSQVPSNISADGPDTTRPTTASSHSDPLVTHDKTSSGNENIVRFVDKTRNSSSHHLDQDIPTDKDLRLGENTSDTSDELSPEGVLPPLLQNEVYAPSGISVSKVDHDKSEAPIVISERSLKRKRQRDQVHIDTDTRQDSKTSTGSALKPIRIKSEYNSSSSIIHGDLSGIDLNVESVDLDAVGDQILTPTKRRRLEHLINISQSEGRLRTLNFSTMEGTTATENLDEDVDGPSPMNPALYAEMNQLLGLKHWEERWQTRDGQAQMRPITQNKQIDRILERQIHSENRELPSISNVDNGNFPRSQSEPINFVPPAEFSKRPSTKVSTTRNSVLQPKTPNTKILPRTYDKSSALLKENSARRKDRGEPPVSILAEDGNDSRSVRASKSSRKTPSTAEFTKSNENSKPSKSPKAHLRLGNLLEGPSPDKPVLDCSTIANRCPGKSRNMFRTPATRRTDKLSEQRKLDFSDTAPNILLGSDKRHCIEPQNAEGSGNTNTVSPDEEPLRSRPLHRLCLDDFKINPKANQGVSYAFSEVVRKQDQRKCLPNCTKPACCGNKFRDLVKIGGFITPRKPGLWDSSPPLDSYEEEQRLIQEFLGISRRELNSLSDTEKQRALEDAKMSHFAQQHGKHKASGNQASPPGFWNVDIPTTQEELENQREANRKEREKVEERYREAKRPNGRWKFRDE